MTSNLKNNKQKLKCFLAILIVLITLFFSHFDSYKSFGFYEDDTVHIASRMGYSINDLKAFSAKMLSNPFKSGRPLSFVIPAFLSAAGYRIGGLPFLYLIGYLVISINSILIFFIILKRFNFNLAFLTALLFVLYPADVTKILLTHIFLLHVLLSDW